MSIMNVAEFAPDMPDIPSSASDSILNVVPATPISYGPQRNLVSYSDAITARCQGAMAAQDNDGNVRVFAGDATKLYRLSAGSVAFDDVSKLGGYSTAAEGLWSFTQFGSRVIATNYADAPQSYVEGSSTDFADLITSGTTTLKAKYVTGVKDFVVFANTTDGTYGKQPQRVWWSAVDDPTNFPTPGTAAANAVLSDFQDIAGEHGAIKGIVGNLGTSDAAIFLERAVYRMVFSGMPDVFSFAPAEGAVGLIAPGGLVQFGGRAFYISEDGFRMFDGTNSLPIGKNKVDRYFYNDLDASRLDRITSAIDPARGLVIFGYPSSSANGVVNRLLFYNMFLDRWSITDTDAIRIQVLVRSATFGKTLEQLNSFGTLDSLPYSLDSQAWIGGRNRLAAFGTDNKFGYFDGEYLQATVDTSDYEPIPGMQSLVNYVRPLVDCSNATVSASARNSIKDAVTYGTASAISSRTGLVPLRARGHYHRQRIIVPAGEAWNHISGIDVVDVQNMGLV